MNQTAVAAGNTSATLTTGSASVLTSLHLGWLVVLALLVIAGIVYGARLKRRRVVAERQVVDHAEEAGVEPQPAAALPAEAPLPAADGAADRPVTLLKGLGPKVAARLGELGVTTVGQVAALDHDAAQALDAQLGAFRGRMERDRWVEQARFLAAGDTAGFEAVFGKL